MHGEHASEDSGIRLEGAHDLLAEGSFPIECEHEARHQHGTRCQRAVLFLVGAKIACGKALGARTIAVSTGTWSRKKLAEHHPDFLIDDLSDVDRLIDTLGW